MQNHKYILGYDPASGETTVFIKEGKDIYRRLMNPEETNKFQEELKLL